MKNNKNKGFVLAEAIVVGVFLMGLLSILIINVLPLIGDYERISRYDNLDKKYDMDLVRRMILIKASSDILSDSNINYSSSKGYAIYNDKSAFCSTLFSTSSNDAYKQYCISLLGENMLDVKTLILSKYDIQNLKNETSNLEKKASTDPEKISRGLGEYIRYLPSDSAIANNYTNYRDDKKIIIEFNDNTYASIEVPYEQD